MPANMSPFQEPRFRHGQQIFLAGMMAVYNSQKEATENIPAQWARMAACGVPEFQAAGALYGASPCTNDGRIHYLTGIAVPEGNGANLPDRLTLAEGEYAVFTVDDMASLRRTWVWVMTEWLASSGRKERSVPEFERYTAPYDPGRASAPVEIWLPLEPAADRVSETGPIP